MSELTRKACQQCRGRKVKCLRTCESDETCSNCQRLNFLCQSVEEPSPYSMNSDSHGRVSQVVGQPYTLAGTLRKRAPRACSACHQQKSRCSGDVPQCKRCRSRGFKCEYLPSRRKVPGSLSPGSVAENQDDSLSIKNVVTYTRPQGIVSSEYGSEVSCGQKFSSSTASMKCDEVSMKTCINSYFDHVYPIPQFSFLHRAVFMGDFGHGKSSPILLRAVCAAGSFYLPSSSRNQHRADVWTWEAESHVLENYDDTSVTNLQTLLLLTFCHSARRKYKKVMVLLSIASRLAYISRMNHERKGLPFMEREIRTRVTWALHMQDSIYAGGLAEFTTFAYSNCHLQLPCPENSFAMDEECEVYHFSNSTKQGSDIGLLSYHILLLSIRDRILRYIRSESPGSCIPNGFLDRLQEFQLELHNFLDSLPKSLQLSERSLLLHAFSPSRSTLIMMHVMWRQCFCDLYRGFFPRLKESFSTMILKHVTEDFIRKFQMMCFEHAAEQANTFRTILGLGTSGSFRVTDPGIAICAYQTAKILCQLEPSVAGNLKATSGDTINRLESCVDICTELQPYFLTVSHIREDIYFMLQYYKRHQGEEHRGNTSEDEIALQKEASWNSVNRVRMMSKHGPLDTIYRSEQGIRQTLDKEINDIGMLEDQQPDLGATGLNLGVSVDNPQQLLSSGVGIPARLPSDENDMWNTNWDFQFQDHDFTGLMDHMFEGQEGFRVDP